MLRLACRGCRRHGQYRVDGLLERFGPEIALPDLQHELAQCPRRGSMSKPCQVEYVRLGRREEVLPYRNSGNVAGVALSLPHRSEGGL
jgi:hypothetical protein